MKQYRCPSCSALKWIPTAECPDCGGQHAPSLWQEEETQGAERPEHPSRLELMGDTGQPLTYHKAPYPHEFGKLLLTRTSSEGRYAGRAQFSLRWSGESVIISPCKDTPCDTLVNGTVLSGDVTLQQGDSIKLRGRTSGREAMPLIAIYCA